MGPSPTIYLLKDKTFGYFETELMDGGIGFMGTYSRQGEDILLKGENETKTIYGFQSNYFLDKNHRDQFAKNPKIVEEIDAETKANEESGNTFLQECRS